jgi:hypothetical protein
MSETQHPLSPPLVRTHNVSTTVSSSPATNGATTPAQQQRGPFGVSVRGLLALVMFGAFFFEAELLRVMRNVGIDPHVSMKSAASVFSLNSGGDSLIKGGDIGAGSADAGAALGAFPSDAELLYEYRDRSETLKLLERLPSELLAPLTVKAQKLLYDWQHPPTCSGRKFMISNGNEAFAGLGSHVHISTAHVGLALEFGAIFLWSNDVGHPYTDPVTCADSRQNIECFFDPPSNCTVEDATSEGAEVIVVSHGDAGLKLPGQLQFYHVPKPFQDLWEDAGLAVVIGENTGQQDAVKYWFRMQVAAYLSRFSRKALAMMKDMRTNATLMKQIKGPWARGEVKEKKRDVDNDGSDTTPPTAAAAAAAAVTTLPHGTISIHIRHGDKHKEMALVPTEDYLKEAARLVKLHPIFLSPYRIFLSTEDPSAIDEMSESIMKGTSTRINSFLLNWWDVPRENSNGPEQLAKFNSLPKAQLTLVWWLQLLLALECDAWIGTRGSNWNRLIDELRCVWVAKCQNIYSEVGDVNRWENVAWRRRS